MVQVQDFFTLSKTPTEANAEENRKVIKGVWGTPAVINGVKLKDKHCLIMRHKSGAVTYMKADCLKDICCAVETSLRYRDVDLYISKNTYINKAVRFDTNTLFGIRNIVIDIDAHGLPAEETCRLANVFLHDLMETHDDFHLPLPNAVVFTGRGLQMWYYLNSAAKKLSFISTAISTKLCDLYSEFLAASPITYADLDLDRASSTRDSGFFRVPGSYNPAAGFVSQAKLLSSGRWDINDLKDIIGVSVSQTHRSASPLGRKGNHATRPHSARDCSHNSCLLSFLYQVAEDGRFLSREVLCHTYHALLLSYGADDEEAAEKVHELNDVFSQPLKEREIAALIRCNERHAYRYSFQTIVDRNCIPDDIVSKFFAKKAESTYRDYRRENSARDIERQKNRVAWHNEIRALANQGLSISEISRVTGHSRNTVAKYINTPVEFTDEFPIHPDHEEAVLKKRAVKLYKNGFHSMDKIARILYILPSEAENYISEYKEVTSAKSESLIHDLSEVSPRDADGIRKLADDFYHLRDEVTHLEDCYANATM